MKGHRLRVITPGIMLADVVQKALQNFQSPPTPVWQKRSMNLKIKLKLLVQTDGVWVEGVVFIHQFP